jgi:hypothetical protein
MVCDVGVPGKQRREPSLALRRHPTCSRVLERGRGRNIDLIGRDTQVGVTRNAVVQRNKYGLLFLFFFFRVNGASV